MVLVAAAVVSLLSGACAGDDTSEPEVLTALPDARPGDTVGLVANESETGRFVEWIDRLDGTIQRLDIDDESTEIETVATIPVGTDGEQRGLLGQVVIDGRRFAAWTQPETFELVVGEIVDGVPGDIVWSAGPARGGAIGGVLGERDGEIVLGLGRNTAWDAETQVGGAMLLIDPDGGPDQEAEAISVGYTNPWAFTVTDDGAVWVADNAAGPDPDDESRDDIERIGRADLQDDRNDMTEITEPGRAPASMVELPDGRIGICGFLDNELVAFEVVDSDVGPDSALERAVTIMPCLTGAAEFDAGPIGTAAQTETGETLQILRE